jgi:hypothetical protein
MTKMRHEQSFLREGNAATPQNLRRTRMQPATGRLHLKQSEAASLKV